MIDGTALRKQAANKYPGVVEAHLRGENSFPLYLRFSEINTTATRDEIRRDMDTLRAESRDAQGGHGLTIETRSIDTTRHGRNDIPKKIYFANGTDYLGYLKKTAEFQTIVNAHEILVAAFPALAQWTPRNWKNLCAGDGTFWQNICRVLAFFRTTPFPQKYIRELPVEVPTKFIENNLPLLEKLLRIVAPGSITDTGETAEERLGLKTDHALIECRFLDGTIMPEWKFRQFTVSLRDMVHLENAGIDTILITENRTNFLTLPPLPRTLALQGQGYAVSRLRNIPFIGRHRIIYWGDLDAHGFEILATLRRHFPKTESIMMDGETWERFASYHIDGTATRNAPEQFSPYLSSDELLLFQKLSLQNRRLEQERIPQDYVIAALEARWCR